MEKKYKVIATHPNGDEVKLKKKLPLYDKETAKLMVEALGIMRPQLTYDIQEVTPCEYDLTEECPSCRL
jgi:hypothetical protein